MKTREEIYKAIDTERAAQDSWGGREHDREHDIHDWSGFIRKQSVALITRPANEELETLIKIAALAVAAIEARKP